MIVKNESHIIEETLENICQNFNLDYWVISDTGSTDNTIEIIEQFFKKKNIAGEIHQAVWQDFAHNRNKALEACEGKADYVLFFDADDLVEGSLHIPHLIYDAYHFQFTNEQYALRYTRRLIVKNDGKYKWKGALHEVVDSKEPVQEFIVEGDYLVISRRKGSRNFDPNKALNDALVLEKAFVEEEDPNYLPRYAFYCGQSYRAHAATDPSYLDKAIEWFKKRTTLQNPWGDIDDEKYIAYENIGLMYEEKKQYDEAIYYWNKGVNLDPKRAECWYHLARRHNWDGKLELAYCFAKQGAELKIPEGSRIFINQEVYNFWCLFELCAITWKLERLEESYATFKRLLPNLPAKYIPNLTDVVKSFVPQIWQDSYQNVMALNQQWTTLGHPNYLNELLATSSKP